VSSEAAVFPVLARLIGGHTRRTSSRRPARWWLVLDVLKPRDPPLVRFTEEVAAVESVEAITGSLIELDPNDRTEIQLSQRFKSEPFAASDYGRVVLTFELTSPDWHGIELLTVAGTLEAGKLLVQEKAIASKSVNPE
jgi:hypothetical protein